MTRAMPHIDLEDMTKADLIRELRKLRGSKMAMIFQDPVTSLNPVFTIGHQVAEALRVHHSDLNRHDANARAVQLLGRVGIPEPERRASDYPHQSADWPFSWKTIQTSFSGISPDERDLILAGNACRLYGFTSPA